MELLIPQNSYTDAKPEAEIDARETSRDSTGQETTMPFVPGRPVPEPIPAVDAITSSVGSSAPEMPLFLFILLREVPRITELAGYGSA